MFTQVPQRERIGLGGGCHWCTEGIFVSLTGVERVERGWIASLPEHLDYYRSDPQRPFCRRYITPKLEALRQRRPELFERMG